MRLALLTGLLGGGGNITFFLALQSGGQLPIVVAMSCLFPVVTVLLARVVLNERVGRTQIAGLGLAVVAAALLTV